MPRFSQGYVKSLCTFSFISTKWQNLHLLFCIDSAKSNNCAFELRTEKSLIYTLLLSRSKNSSQHNELVDVLFSVRHCHTTEYKFSKTVFCLGRDMRPIHSNMSCWAWENTVRSSVISCSCGTCSATLENIIIYDEYFLLFECFVYLLAKNFIVQYLFTAKHFVV